MRKETWYPICLERFVSNSSFYTSKQRILKFYNNCQYFNNIYSIIFSQVFVEYCFQNLASWGYNVGSLIEIINCLYLFSAFFWQLFMVYFLLVLHEVLDFLFYKFQFSTQLWVMFWVTIMLWFICTCNVTNKRFVLYIMIVIKRVLVKITSIGLHKTTSQSLR